jgi:hypothetical protein
VREQKGCRENILPYELFEHMGIFFTKQPVVKKPDKLRCHRNKKKIELCHNLNACRCPIYEVDKLPFAYSLQALMDLNPQQDQIHAENEQVEKS